MGIIIPNQAQSKTVKEVCRRWNGQLIDFYTMNMDELSIIAKHRVLPTATLLFFQNGRLVGRMVGNSLDSITEITRALHAIEGQK